MHVSPSGASLRDSVTRSAFRAQLRAANFSHLSTACFERSIMFRTGALGALAALVLSVHAAHDSCEGSESCSGAVQAKGAGLLQHGSTRSSTDHSDHQGCKKFVRTCLGNTGTAEEEQAWYHANWTAWKVGFVTCCSAKYSDDLCGSMDQTLFDFLGGAVSGGEAVQDAPEPEMGEFCTELGHLLETHFDHTALEGTSLALQQALGQAKSKTLKSLGLHREAEVHSKAASGTEAVKRRIGQCRKDQVCWEQVSNMQGFFLELESTGGTGECFPAGSLVAQAGEAPIEVEKLKRGMALWSPKFSEEGASLQSRDFLADCHMFDGFSDNIMREYVEISHEVSEKTGRPLMMSSFHLLFLLPAGKTNWLLARAEEVRVGDTLLALSPSPSEESLEQTQLSQVTGLKKVMARGAFAPLTTSGRLFVEGVAVSSMAISGDAIVRFYESHSPESRLSWAEGFYTLMVGPITVLHSLNLPIGWYVRAHRSIVAVYSAAMDFISLLW